ncbi:MAG: hypothetical protein KKF56_03670 [Nanoarchaeota archaeon]|nr:hypothetical protein [Nanoarchaeota archaeon]
MKDIKINKIGIFLVGAMFILTLCMPFIFAIDSSSTTTSTFPNNPSSSSSVSGFSGTSPSYSNFPDNSQFWPIYGNQDTCYATQDFILNIPLGGCSPAIVRSDLLEEQPVPVFCKVDALKINPFADISMIKGVTFSARSYPPEVSGIGFHPIRSALRVQDQVLDTPFYGSIGYLVVTLKRIPAERDMPEWIQVNLTGKLGYDVSRYAGPGQNEYYLELLTEDEWKQKYKDNNLLKGKAYIRAEWIENDEAEIGLYDENLQQVQKVKLKQGQTSDDIYMPGFYCKVGLRITLSAMTYADREAKLEIDNNIQWVRVGTRFLDDRCRVLGIDVANKKVRIECAPPRKSFELKLKGSSGTEINNGINNINVNVGEVVNPSEQDVTKRYWSVYSGSVPKNLDATEEKFLILVKNVSSSHIENLRVKQSTLSAITTKIERISAKTQQEYLNKLLEIKDVFGNNFDVNNIKLLKVGEKDSESGFIYNKPTSGPDKDFSGGSNPNAGRILNEYYNEAKATAENLDQMYGGEACVEGKCGEVGLRELVQLSGAIGKQYTRNQINQRLGEGYNVGLANDNVDTSDASIQFELDGRFHTVRLLDVKDSAQSGNYGDFTIVEGGTSKPKRIGIGQYIDNQALIKLIDLKDDRATFEYFEKDQNSNDIRKTSVVQLYSTVNILGNVITFNDVKLKKVAKVSVNTNSPAGFTDTNFTFKIAIEKRAIELSPNKTSKLIDKINKTVQKLEDISEKLGEVVKVMKLACFATSTILTVKTFFENLGGRGMARQKVMGYWYDNCEQESQGDKNLFNACLKNNNAQIEGDINNYAGNLQSVNNNLQNIQNNNLNPANGAVDGSKALAAYKIYMNKYVGTTTFTTESGKTVSVTADMINSAGTLQELRDLELAALNSKAGASTGKAGNNEGYGVANRLQQRVAIDNSNQNAQSIFGNGISVDLDYSANGTVIRGYHGQSWKNFRDAGFSISGNDGTVKDETPAQALTVGGLSYIAILGKRISGVGSYNAVSWYEVGSGKSLTAPLSREEVDRRGLSSIQFARRDPSALVNPWRNPTVRFYDSGNFKGLPAVVPLGRRLGEQEGWYVATMPFSIENKNTKAYTDAGQMRNFYICNVGANGLEEFESSLRDDQCQFINLDIRKPDNVLGLPVQKSNELVDKSEKALRQAAEGFANIKPGEDAYITILDGRYKVGKPGRKKGGRCQDFMSPQDCYILFNVCDPVICPPSRCDMGGAYPVDDVIQTGIVGSIALCLPNIKEGIMVPVCISGIHAGIEGLTSILRATRDCMVESLKTGQNIGICDEIQSIYLCEFLWRQLTPIMNMLIPAMIESTYGQGTRGGGEYLTVQNAWQNVEGSIDYMTNQYAVNAFNAFKARSTDDVGGEICKMFISARYPSNKDFFDALLEPESPHQFSAWFHEIPYSEATTPATSQYKVYYHIYAGKNRGVYYSVYLRDPPESSQYNVQPMIVVDTGFIGVGQYADQAKDFTAPKGYKQLCVRIDNKEECGFKQVSSDFALNIIKDTYASEQATQRATSTQTCVGGTASIYAFSSLNIQEGAQEALNPEMGKRGIVRVCATDNPGKSTNAARWTDVGVCDEPDMKCWLDTDSVKNAITARNIENQTLQAAGFNVTQYFDSTGVYTPQYTNSMLVNLKIKLAEINFNSAYGERLVNEGGTSAAGYSETEFGRLIRDIKDLQERAHNNNYKARAMLLEFQAYERAVRAVYLKYFGKEHDVEHAPVTSGDSATEGVYGLRSEDFNAGEQRVIAGIKIYSGEVYTGIFIVRHVNEEIIYITDGNLPRSIGRVINGVLDININQIPESKINIKKYAAAVDNARVDLNVLSIVLAASSSSSGGSSTSSTSTSGTGTQTPENIIKSFNRYPYFDSYKRFLVNLGNDENGNVVGVYALDSSRNLVWSSDGSDFTSVEADIANGDAWKTQLKGELLDLFNRQLTLIPSEILVGDELIDKNGVFYVVDVAREIEGTVGRVFFIHKFDDSSKTITFRWEEEVGIDELSQIYAKKMN